MNFIYEYFKTWYRFYFNHTYLRSQKSQAHERGRENLKLIFIPILFSRSKKKEEDINVFTSGGCNIAVELKMESGEREWIVLVTESNSTLSINAEHLRWSKLKNYQKYKAEKMLNSSFSRPKEGIWSEPKMWEGNSIEKFLNAKSTETELV